MTILDIRTAIQHEVDATPKSTYFKVLAIDTDHPLLRLTLQASPIPGAAPAELEDHFIGAIARWRTGSTESSAKVLYVASESGVAVLKDLSGPLPHANQDIELIPTDYLWALKKCWHDDDWAQQAVACLDDFASPKLTHGVPLSSANIARLRPAQRQTFALVGLDLSFIMGPPGTGKTTVLGVLLGAYLAANPQARVLVLCTTNRAVDEVVISVDNALLAACQLALRHSIRRMGPEYDKKKFEQRQHLIPGNCANFDQDPICVRLIASTVTRAIMTLGTLRKEAQFDLLVMDEASQVSLAHTLALMPLGKIRLFAGDPIQLAPVSLGNSSCTKRWISQSAFAHMPPDGPSVCLLNEQSRMAEPICTVISTIFYNGALRVAVDALNDRNWLQQRKVKFGNIPRSHHVSIHKIATNASRSQGSRKFRRMESVERILLLIRSAIGNRDVAQKDIVVITAFRKQANIIRAHLRLDNLYDIKVDTVHRSQGIEAKVVIFDPVDGLHVLLMREKGRQLINVALSRAQAKLILMLSDRDLQNPTFAQILETVAIHTNRSILQVAQVLREPTYLTSAIGMRVAINGRVADITRFSRDGTMMWADMEDTGIETIFDVTNLS